jgi:tRNA(adenine34) deaminase
VLGEKETGGGHLPGGRALKGVRFPDGCLTAAEAGGVLSCTWKYDKILSNYGKEKSAMHTDLDYLHRAVQLACDARQMGNLPIGAVITLDGEIVAEGKNTIWAPVLAPNRHAEIEALEALPPGLRARAGEMTLYTTLEPCLMCLGAILVYHIGRVVFGAYDHRGGCSCVLDYMPPAFERIFADVEWIGPAFPQVCDELSQEVAALVIERQRRMR